LAFSRARHLSQAILKIESSYLIQAHTLLAKGMDMTRLTLGQRIFLGAVAALALWVGVWCYFVPSRSEVAIPWGVSTLCAAFFGSIYLSGAVFTGTSMLGRRWVDARMVMPMIALWTGGLTIISLFYLPLFDFTRKQVWVWFGAYTIYPLIALWLMWTHRQESSIHPVDEPAIPEWAKHYLQVQGSMLAMLGLGLLLAPQVMRELWPWSTGRLMLQLYSGPLLTYAIGSFLFARQHAWSEIRLGLVSMGVFTGAQLLAALFYLPLFDGHPLSIAIWVVWLALTTGMLSFLSWKAFSKESAAEREPLLVQS
jgi:hypothetical protein